jgi:hypothetical protein
MGGEPEWMHQKLDCIPSLDIFHDPDFNQEGNVRINPIDGKGIFTEVVHPYPGNNVPITIFRKERDDQQCAILDVPYASKIEFVINKDGGLPDKALGTFSRMFGFPDTKIIFLFDKEKGSYAPHKCSWLWFYNEGNITITREDEIPCGKAYDDEPLYWVPPEIKDPMRYDDTSKDADNDETQ